MHQSAPIITDPNIDIRHMENGATRLDLVLNGNSVGHMQINHQRIHIDSAMMDIAYITDVWTEEAERGCGYGRRLQEAALEWMRQGLFCLALLHGIFGFYPKFGYTTSGPGHFIHLTELYRSPPIPAGWNVRQFTIQDMQDIQRLYTLNTLQSVGAAERLPNSSVWSKLAAIDNGTDECRVLENPDGQVKAYAWRGSHFWFVQLCEQYEPGALVLAEVMAEDDDSANAVLAMCRAWANEITTQKDSSVWTVNLSLPPEGLLANAAMMQDAKFMLNCFPDGGFMGQVLDTYRTLKTLQPELSLRFLNAKSSFAGTIHLQTDRGDALLSIDSNGVSITIPNLLTQPAQSTVELPQTTITRLVLGAFPPEYLLARFHPHLDVQIRQLLAILFPLRKPHMYPADREGA